MITSFANYYNLWCIELFPYGIIIDTYVSRLSQESGILYNFSWW